MPNIDQKYIYKNSPEDITIDVDLHSCITPENPGYPMTLILKESIESSFKEGKFFHCFVYDRYYYEEGDGYDDEVLEGKEYEEGNYYIADLLISKSKDEIVKFSEGKDKDYLHEFEDDLESGLFMIGDNSKVWKFFPRDVMEGLHENALENFGACEGFACNQDIILEQVSKLFEKEGGA